MVSEVRAMGAKIEGKMVSPPEETSIEEERIGPFFLIGYLSKTLEFAMEYVEKGADKEIIIDCLKEGIEKYKKFGKLKGWDE